MRGLKHKVAYFPKIRIISGPKISGDNPATYLSQVRAAAML